MPAAPLPRILVCADREVAVEDVRRLLEQAGHEVRWHQLNGTDPANAAGFHLVVLDGTRCEHEALQFCRRLRSRISSEAFVPILFLTEDHSPTTRLASLEGGADTYLLRPFAPGELLAQVQAFLRIKDVHDRLADKSAEVHRINKRLQQAYQQIDQELELAQRIQLGFLPQTLPEVPQLRFAVRYTLCGRVGGDFYDVFRLDENHVGFYVADAMGHGVPASLLAIFVKKDIRAKEIAGRQYRLLPPGEVLQSLNRDLIGQALSESPFITMVYGLYNFKELSLTFARAGHPYPLHVPRHGEPVFWEVSGSLLGVFETTFPSQARRLEPGDKLLLYSDGIDGGGVEGAAQGSASLLACAARHRALPVQEFIEQVARDLFSQARQTDDLTLLGMEVLG
jgi:sigma-B regulation protein RsbU (phosphoserine phosphatase)